MLDGTVAHVDCRVTEELTASTHTIFLGEVLEAGHHDGEPLGYFNRAYRDFRIDRA